MEFRRQPLSDLADNVARRSHPFFGYLDGHWRTAQLGDAFMYE